MNGRVASAAWVEFDPQRKSGQLYSASTIMYTDAAKPIGRLATPADVRIRDIERALATAMSCLDF